MAGGVRQGCPPGQLLPVHHGLHRWATPRKKKINNVCAELTSSPKRFVGRLVACKVSALPVLSYVGLLAAPDQATVTDESRALQRLAAGPYDSIPTKVGLMIAVCRIHGFSLAARFQFAAHSDTLSEGLEKLQAARSSLLTTLHAASTDWDRTFLHRSMEFATTSENNLVHWMDQSGRKLCLPAHKLQIAACGMLLGP